MLSIDYGFLRDGAMEDIEGPNEDVQPEPEEKDDQGEDTRKRESTYHKPSDPCRAGGFSFLWNYKFAGFAL